MKRYKKHGLRYIVTKPQGITWMGKSYEYGQLLPRSIAAHAKFPVLLRIGYIAAADAPVVHERRIKVKERKQRRWREVNFPRRGRARRRV